MSGHVYHEIYLHFNWHTKDDLPLLTGELVQELKGASSFQVNKRVNRKALEWQRGYGVVSIGRGNLDWVREYIRRQREHHAKGRVETRLELHDTFDELADKPG